MSINFFLPASIRRRGRIGLVALDATINETHDFTNRITDQAVEEGFNITDHVVSEPESITIQGFVTNTPTDANAIDNISSNVTFLDAAQRAFDELYRSWQSKELISVSSYYRLYTSMIITSLSVPRDSATGGAIRFSVTCRKVNVAGASTFDLFSRALSPVTGALGEARRRVNAGRQRALGVSDNAASTATSLLQGVL